MQKKPSIYDATMSAARNEMGVREEGGDNRGPRVEQYQKAGKTYKGAPWCAAYVNFCAEEGARQSGTESPLEGVPNQAYVQSYVEHFKKQGKTFTALKEARPGDLFCIWFPSSKRYAHMGFVRSIDVARGRFTTNEGNSNDEGSRQGYEVCSNNRIHSGRVLFIRWA